MRIRAPLFLAALLCAGGPIPSRARASSPDLAWKRLQPGVEYAKVRVSAKLPVQVSDDNLHIVRVTPGRARLRALVASELGVKPMTAKEWADRHKLSAVINLGMYQADHRTHVGYLRSGRHVNSKAWIKAYHSVLAFDSGQGAAPGLARALMLDRDQGFEPSRLAPYAVVVQNLRLIRGPDSGESGQGRGVWSAQDRRWSEAALAADRAGRLLFLFCRAPLSMHDFNALVLGLPLAVVRAMHLEGGPEASLSIRAKGLRLDLEGSFETGFFGSDLNHEQWPIPNVLGVERE